MNIHGVRGFGVGIGILSLFGFGLLLIGAFHTDRFAGRHTIEGAIHGFAAESIFWLFPVASLLIAPSLKKDPRWKSLYIYSIAAAILAVALMMGGIWIKDGTPYYGLFERVLVADEIIWVEIMAIWLLRLSLRRGE